MSYILSGMGVIWAFKSIYNSLNYTFKWMHCIAYRLSFKIFI